jgi:hypothetical protein
MIIGVRSRSHLPATVRWMVAQAQTPTSRSSDEMYRLGGLFREYAQVS